MDTAQNHIIQYEVFEIEGCQRVRAVELQNRVSRMADGLRDIMEEVFGKVAGPGSLIKIDQLQLDMGILPYDHFEEHFIERFAGILEKELLARITTIRPITSGAGDEQETVFLLTCLELLEYFLVKGVLPWWASGKLLNEPPAVMNRLFRGKPDSLESLIRRVGQSLSVRQRLVYQFPEEAIHSLLKLLEPGQAVFMLAYHGSLSKVQKLKRVMPAELPSFERAVWLFILSYLLIDKGNQFNRREFVRSTLHQMANHFNRDYRQLLGLFAAVLPTDDPVFQLTGALPRILKDLASEQGLLPEAKQQEAKGKDLKQELIRYYLLYGSLPFPAASLHATELSGIFTVIIQRMPVFVKDMMRSFYDLPAIPLRIAENMDEKVVHSLIVLLEPSGAPLINRYLESLPILQQQRPLVNTEYKDFGKAIRGVVLSFLLSERGSVFNTKTFLQSNIRGMARHFNIHYRDLLVSLLQGWEREPLSGGDSFLPLLRLLLEEEEKSAGVDKGKETKERQERVEQEERWRAEEKLRIKEEAEKRTITALERQRETELRKKEIEIREKQEKLERRNGEKGEIENRERPVMEKKQEMERNEPVLWEIRSRDLLRYWIYYGRLPWWGADEAGSPEGIWKELMKRAPRSILSLLHWTGGSAVRRERLLSLLSAGGVLESIQSLPGGELAVRHYHAMLSLTGKEGALRIRSETEQRVLLLQALWDTGMKGNFIRWEEAVFVRRVLLRLAGWTGLYPSVLALALWRAAKREKEFSRSFALLTALQEAAEGAAVQDLSITATGRVEEWEKPEQSEEEVPGREEWEGRDEEEGWEDRGAWEESYLEPGRKKEVKEWEAREEGERRPDGIMEGTIYIENAGLVLLHPFLSTYFSRLGLLGPEGFTGEAAQFKAVHLLQYLADGMEEHPEQELALNKILCGLPVDEPVPLHLSFTEQEKEVSVELLNVLRVQWEKLKNTSNEGIRASFLQRQGALTETGEGWKLRVEQRAYDVLLQTLPWGLGMIRLSWMKKIIYTEWS
ncbi:MAG TPA: contractile injection system tape measure protein [Puia sp.]|nr:contractile injection system tape measure protein [Puia sp.]